MRTVVVLFLILTALLLLGASSRNIAPDAVSRATIWNSHVGALVLLQDGKVPPQDVDAQPFTWETKGILVFVWEEPLELEKLRIYVGDIGNNYEVRSYLGGRLDESGTLREPEGERTALVAADSRVVDQWIEVLFPEGTTADNIELWTLGPTVFYEVEIYVRGADATVVERLSWGRVKIGRGKGRLDRR